MLGKRSMTPETAVLLEEALGASAEMWMRLQCAYDIFKARERLVRRPRRASRPPLGGELPSLRIDPPPDPLDELLERHPIVKLGMQEAKAVRERVRRIHEASRDAARYAGLDARPATPRKRG